MTSTKAKEKRKPTHDSSEVTVRLFNDSEETPRSQIEEFPTSSHRLPVPSRHGVFADGFEVALLFVEELELNEGSEIVRVGEEELEQATRRIHPFSALICLERGRRGRKG